MQLPPVCRPRSRCAAGPGAGRQPPERRGAAAGGSGRPAGLPRRPLPREQPRGRARLPRRSQQRHQAVRRKEQAGGELVRHS